MQKVLKKYIPGHQKRVTKRHKKYNLSSSSSSSSTSGTTVVQ